MRGNRSFSLNQEAAIARNRGNLAVIAKNAEISDIYFEKEAINARKTVKS